MQPFVEVILKVLERLETIRTILAQYHVVLNLIAYVEFERRGRPVVVVAVCIRIGVALRGRIAIRAGTGRGRRRRRRLRLDKFAHFARFDVHLAIEIVQAKQIFGTINATLFRVNHCSFGYDG